MNRVDYKNRLPLYTAIEKRADNEVRDIWLRDELVLTLILNVRKLGQWRAVKIAPPAFVRFNTASLGRPCLDR